MRTTATLLATLMILGSALVLAPGAAAYRGCGSGVELNDDIFDNAIRASERCIEHARSIYCGTTSPNEPCPVDD